MEIARRQAQLEGKTRYFSPEPCINGHISDRYVSNGGCVKCNSVSRKKYYKQNREKMQKYYRGYYEKVTKPLLEKSNATS